MKSCLQAVLILSALSVFIVAESPAQGCVAIRQAGGCGAASGSALLTKGQWQANLNYRFFRSFRHFRGDHEEMNRVEMGTQVVNVAHIADFGLAYSLSNRLSLAANLPIIVYDRSSLYEHYGNSTTSNPEQKRFHTGSSGIGDLRLSANYWLFNPEQHMSTNIALGLGLKFPSGNSNVQDKFHKRSTIDGSDSIAVRAVDQSIQLGDGGVGFTVEMQAFASVSPRATVYMSAFYLSNPKNTNKTLTRGTTENVDPLIAYHSVADQYLARLGIAYALLPAQSLLASLGGRIEGIPPRDVFGKSDGFRRPGYIVAIEPGFLFQNNRFNVALTVPVALYRNRTKSTYDRSDPSGQRHGDAAFADYSINLGFGYRFGGKHEMMDVEAPKWKEVGQ